MSKMGQGEESNIQSRIVKRMRTTRAQGAGTPTHGLTVIDLVVVVAIIAILAAIFMVNLPKIRAGFEMRNAASLTVSEVRRAQAGSIADPRFPYTVEFIVANPGGLRIYKARLSTETCPAWMVLSSDGTNFWCTRTVDGAAWPSSISIESTTLLDCSAVGLPAGTIAGNDNCVTFGFLGAPTPNGTVVLRSTTGGTARIVIEPATGKVSVQ